MIHVEMKKKSKDPEPLFKRRLESEEFAEKFRVYWIRKNKKLGQ